MKEDTLDARTMQFTTNHCILTAVAPLRQDRSTKGQLPWYPEQLIQTEVNIGLHRMQMHDGTWTQC